MSCILITVGSLLILGYTPIDGIPKSDIAQTSLSTVLAIIVLNITGLVFALVCLVFNTFFRHKK